MDHREEMHVPNPLNGVVGGGSPVAPSGMTDGAALPAKADLLEPEEDDSCFHIPCRLFNRLVHNLRVVARSPRTHKAFILTVFLQSLWLIVSRVTLIVQASIYGSGDVNVLQWWYLALMVLSGWFVQSFAFEAVAKANACELGAFIIVSILLVTRDGLSAFSASQDCNGGKDGSSQSECIVFFGITCAFNVVYWALALLMFTDLRWIKYKAIGTDKRLRAMYLRYELFSAVKKLDVQFSLVVLATGLVFYRNSRLEIIFAVLNGLLVFVELGWEVLANRAVKRASKAYAAAFFVVSLPMPALVIAVSVLAKGDYPIFDGAKAVGAEDEVVGLLLCAVVNRAVTMFCMGWMMTSFGTPDYDDLVRLFRSQKHKVIGLDGMRPPPVPICGCDFARCVQRCGPRCAACCCDKPATSPWERTDADADAAAAGWAESGVELGAAGKEAGWGAGVQPSEGLAEPPPVGGDSFMAAYMAATTSRVRADIVAPTGPSGLSDASGDDSGLEDTGAEGRADDGGPGADAAVGGEGSARGGDGAPAGKAAGGLSLAERRKARRRERQERRRERRGEGEGGE